MTETQHEPGARDRIRLSPELEPPVELEDAVVGALRREGLLRRPESVGRGWLVAATVAAFLAGGVATWLVGRLPAPSPSAAPAESGPVYALLLYQDSRFEESSGSHRPERVEEYRRWLASLREAGRFADGERLASTGLVLYGDGRSEAADPADLSGAKGRLTGFFLIEAEDDAEATSIAEACPHLGHGGTVELRRIERGG